MRGKLIKCVGWNESCDENDTNEILFATKDSKIYTYRIDCRTQDYREDEAKIVVQISNER